MIIHWETCSDGTGANAVATLSCIPLILSSIVYWALVFAGIVAIFLVIYAGFKYINSGGDPKQADTARKTLLYAIFGLFLVFMSFFIVRAIGEISGLNRNCYTLFGFSNCNTGSTPNSNNPGGDNPDENLCNPSCTNPLTCQYDSDLGMNTCK